MVQATLAILVEDIFLNSSLVIALNNAFNALLLKFAALILALSQSVGTSFGLVQPMWVKQNKMESDGREVQNPDGATSTVPHYILR